MIAGFFRHGIAVPHGTPGVAESERPLTPEGKKKTRQAARGLKRLDLGFDGLFTSPLPRAQQTAEILAEILKFSKPKVLDLLLPGTPPRSLLDGLRPLKEKRPLLVGHEPLLSAAVSLAIGKGAIELKKAGMALVEMEKTSGTLRLLLTPAALRALA